MAYDGTKVAGGEGNTTFHATSKYDGLGKELEIFTVDFVDAMNGQQDKDEDQYTGENTIRQYGNIVAAGPLGNSNTEKTYISEGTDMYVGAPAGAGGAFTFTETTGGSSTATLQTALRAMTGQNGAVTSTNKTLVIAV
jgi:hypothetical protein